MVGLVIASSAILVVLLAEPSRSAVILATHSAPVQIRLADIDVDRALAIALDLGLYAYDAYVLETARARYAPLLTLDDGMARAARRLGLKLVEL
jgi:predicted nucleic acid-binding protein